MRTRFACWLDGMGLQDIDESVCITDIRENAPALKLTTGAGCGGDGTRLLARARQNLTVTICFEVHAYEPRRRAQVLADIAAWVHDGVLTVSYRENQQLRVVYTALPGIGSALQWQDVLTVTFAAYALPYWEDVTPASAHLDPATTDGTVSLTPRGTAEMCCLEADITNASAWPVTTLTLSCGQTHFTLTPLSLASGKTLRIFYDADRRLVIAADGVSLLDRRTGDSSDDLLLRQRTQNIVRLQADKICRADFHARGRYL